MTARMLAHATSLLGCIPLVLFDMFPPFQVMAARLLPHVASLLGSPWFCMICSPSFQYYGVTTNIRSEAVGHLSNFCGPFEFLT